MSIIIPANSAVGGGFEVANSLRFNRPSSDYLNRTQSGGSAPTKATFSTWLKRTNLGIETWMFDAPNSSNQSDGFRHLTGDTLQFLLNDSYVLTTNRLFRDVSAWYHLVVAMDTTQNTDSNRVKLYVNGVQETSFSATSYPSQNATAQGLFVSGRPLYIGRQSGGNYLDGYLAETVFIDGQALAPTSFGEFDEDSGVWKPIDVSGLTFGTNGCYLDFEDSSALGNDAAGSNNFTVNNLTAIDQSTDTCTNNFATLNPLFKQDGVFSEGNLAYTISASDFDSALSTIAPSLGKWYFETKITAQAGSNTTRSAFGICDVRDGNLISEDELGQNPSGRLGDTLGYAGNGSGNVLKNGSDQGSGFNTTYGTNDILSCAVDLDNGAVYYRKNGGSWFNSGNPESGASKTGAVTITTGQEYVFGNTAYAGSAFIMNFGNPAFTGTDQADGNDRGSFEYAVPSGYLALCSLNLSEVLS